ncbi:MAG: hypothetical protein C0469_13590 [Cyanobacteria bacterium DS2.3.42]|nr:hypothetical protein [Cyanobacteria bacterium DS2.3.42]
MQISTSTIKYSAVAMLCSLLMVTSLPSQSATGAAQGVALYKQGKYADAVKVLDGVCQNPTTDPNTLYYYALSLHQTGNFDKARRAYMRVAQQYPSSAAGRMASQALTAFGSPGHSSGSGSTGGGASSGESSGSPGDNLPESAKIYFKPDAQSQMMVDVYVNNRPIKMVFDTGADDCAFGKNHLQELGMAMPTGKPQFKAKGVGDGGAQNGWIVPATVRVGNIERKMTIGVQEHLPTEPLLGQSFYHDYMYTIDKGSNSITFTRKRRGGATSIASGGAHGLDRNTIPFEKLGNSLSVVATVNGKPIRCIFDTGATGTVFAFGDMKSLGINIPADAEETSGTGIAGPTKGVAFPLQRMTLGPIDRSDFHISVLEGFEAGHPLIGRSFLGDWQYTIDNDARLIHFLRR